MMHQPTFIVEDIDTNDHIPLLIKNLHQIQVETIVNVNIDAKKPFMVKIMDKI